MRNRLLAGDDRLRFAITKPLAAFDDRVREARANRSRLGVERDERGFAQSRHAFLKRAYAVAQNFRQHRNDVAGKIRAVAALVGFDVERRALLYEKRYVRDVNAEFPISVVE